MLGLITLPNTADTQPNNLTNKVSLCDWNKQVRYPTLDSQDPTIMQLLKGAQSQQPLAFFYFGGSSPRQLRLVTVESVFSIENSPHRYVAGYCHLRHQHRTFRSDRISLA